MLELREIVWVVQVNGKVRARITLPAGMDDAKLKEAVLSDEQVARHVGAGAVKQVIIVPNKLVNIVA